MLHHVIITIIIACVPPSPMHTQLIVWYDTGTIEFTSRAVEDCKRFKEPNTPGDCLYAEKNAKKFLRRGTIARITKTILQAAAEGKLDLVEGALKKGWSLKRDPFDVVKDDPYADIEYDRSWSDPQYELVHDENFENYGSTALHRAAIFDNGECTEKVCKVVIDAGWDCQKLTRMVTHRQMMHMLLVMSISIVYPVEARQEINYKMPVNMFLQKEIVVCVCVYSLFFNTK